MVACKARIKEDKSRNRHVGQLNTHENACKTHEFENAEFNYVKHRISESGAHVKLNYVSISKGLALRFYAMQQCMCEEARLPSAN